MSQYVKNTDVPSSDSFLWQLADDWKISKKTGIPYASLERVTDEVLGTAITQMSETNKLDVVEYQNGFFVPANFNGKWSVYAFENEPEAKKKLADTLRFASYNNKPTATATTNTVPKPKPVTTASFTSKPVSASTLAPTQSTIRTPDRPGTQMVTMRDTITTYTDPTPVEYDNLERIATLRQDGFSFLPSSIVERNTWDRSIYDDDNNIVGTQLICLMGRIINVEIGDNK